nr:hypothetical protein [Tanacetum cinerariifolium]
ERNGKEFYREFSEYMCRMLQNRQKSEASFPLPLDFMKCSPITFRGNNGAVGLIKWIEKTEMVFTVSKCTEANKVVFVAATFHDQALTWWNSQVPTLGIEVVTRKTWTEMKMAHTLMKQKIKATVEREADNKKMTWENFQGGSSSGGGNNNRRGGARGQAYTFRDGDQNLGPNVVTGTFLLNN